MSEIRIIRPQDHQGYFKLWGQLQAELPWNDSLDELLSKVGADDFDKRCSTFKETARELFKQDLYALMRFGSSCGDRVHANLGVKWLDQPWLFKTICRVDSLNRESKLHRLWLYWTRGGFKTTTIQHLCMQKIFQKPDIRINYYSRTEPMARDRAGGIKLELETNLLFHLLFPEILWGRHPKDAGAEDWSDGSFTVRRESAGRAAEAMSESTVKCWGISAVGTGGHPEINVLDDVVDDTNAHSPAQAKKTARQMAATTKASDPSDAQHRQDWIIGTDYGNRTAYKISQEEGLIRDVWYEGAVDFERYGRMDQKTFDEQLSSGEIEGVLLTNAELRDYRGKGTKAWVVFCQQYLCRVDLIQKKRLDAARVSFYTSSPEEVAHNANLYACSDPAGFPGMSQEQQLSNSAMGIFALCQDGNMRLIDGRLDQLSATERMMWLLSAVRRWSRVGNFIEARLEEGGTGGDVSTLCMIQQHQNYVFDVVRVTRGGGPGALQKTDRIHNLVEPLLDKLFIPQRMVRQRNNELSDLVATTREALDAFPGASDDAFNWLDMIALMNEPIDKTVMVFRGGREPETRAIGPLVWPRIGDWNPRPSSPTLGDIHPKHRAVLGLFGAANVQVSSMRRQPSRDPGLDLF